MTWPPGGVAGPILFHWGLGREQSASTLGAWEWTPSAATREAFPGGSKSSPASSCLSNGWAFHGLTWLTDHAHQSPAIHAHVRLTGSTIPTFESPTLRTTTPTTAQIVPLPPDNNCPSCIPQPSFAPAP